MTIMQTIAIQCPRCHRRFALNAPDLGAMASRPFRCPKCGFSAPFGQLMGRIPQAPAPLHTHIAGGQPGVQGGKTRVASKSGVASLVIEDSGRTLPLAQGSYIIGRASSDSTATLKLAPDPYMSRQHARLDVIAAGSVTQCRITALNPANDVFVNSRRLSRGEAAELRDNDRILLGMTKVIVKI